MNEKALSAISRKNAKRFIKNQIGRPMPEPIYLNPNEMATVLAAQCRKNRRHFVWVKVDWLRHGPADLVLDEPLGVLAGDCGQSLFVHAETSAFHTPLSNPTMV